MPRYLYQLAYTSDSWAAQMKDPQNRVEKVRGSVEQLGGKVVDAYYTFGDYDIIVILDMPDNKSAAAFAIAVAGGGAAKAARTTPLMSIEEGIEAIRKGGQSSYRPAGA
jgi:uncharacterized protein with GYD domain